jgi:hypothetical protein
MRKSTTTYTPEFLRSLLQFDHPWLCAMPHCSSDRFANAAGYRVTKTRSDRLDWNVCFDCWVRLKGALSHQKRSYESTLYLLGQSPNSGCFKCGKFGRYDFPFDEKYQDVFEYRLGFTRPKGGVRGCAEHRWEAWHERDGAVARAILRAALDALEPLRRHEAHILALQKEIKRATKKGWTCRHSFALGMLNTFSWEVDQWLQHSGRYLTPEEVSTARRKLNSPYANSNTKLSCTRWDYRATLRALSIQCSDCASKV